MRRGGVRETGREEEKGAGRRLEGERSVEGEEAGEEGRGGPVQAVSAHLGTLRPAWPGAGLQPVPSTPSQSQGMGASGRMLARFQEWTWQSVAGLSPRADKPGCG